ncbi:unnamed protein product [Schistosoma margrebowiei]|uniref:Uncharacterized protein n=1 Tax=Schistosoma margrebowiei TaxID=48269 RepID=A0A183LL77_9TREM|nr:unnamed protein product [Schistosoma margrebowiei]
MERLDNLGNREDQSNSNRNEETQLGSTRNQRNPLNPNWTVKVRFRRDAAVLRLRREKSYTHSRSGSGVPESLEFTYRTGISRI